MKKRMAYKMMALLREKKLTLALAESMTCGLMAHRLGNMPGTTEVLKGGIVCYDPAVKTSLCKVPAEMIAQYSPESQAVTDMLAKNLPQLFDADIFAAVTGLAAPGGSECPGKPVGSVFLSVNYNGKIYSLNKVFNGTPLEIKKKACNAAFSMIVGIVGA
jgi:nicotinamide-nucleotide amidase